jgi:hypothetical protein
MRGKRGRSETSQVPSISEPVTGLVHEGSHVIGERYRFCKG